MNLKNLIGDFAPRDMDARIRESIKLRAPFQHFSTVMITDRDKIIKGIAQSKPNNLILDNFGTWFAGLFNAPAQSLKVVSLKGIDAVSRDYEMRGSYVRTAFSEYKTGDIGTHMQVGSGTTTAVRADYIIETALGTSPEDAVFDTGTGSYAAGVVSIAGAITAGGAGTINETGTFGYWQISGGASIHDVMLFHDTLVSGEAFVASDTITQTNTIQL